MRATRISTATTAAIATLALGVASCTSNTKLSEGPPTTESTSEAASAPTTDSPLAPTQPAHTSPTTTAAPTTTTPITIPGPPVFDPAALGDNRDLPSFVLTATTVQTINGELNESTVVSSYVNEPRRVSELSTFSYDDTVLGLRRFIIGGRYFEETQSGDWYLYESGSPGAPDLTNRLDPRSGVLAPVLTADFVGDAEFAGLVARHFVFDETDLYNYSSYTAENPSPDVEGEFYLSTDGSNMLYAHSKETSPGRTYEVTETLSSIGEVGDIVLPADLTPMSQALDLGVAFGAILPPGATLSTMIRYEHGIGIDYYSYRGSVRTSEDLVSFYRALPPTDGWTVSHIGHIRPHLEEVNCETKVDCVILTNGGEQIVVSLYGGTIILEYDHDHVFTPL